MSALNKEVSDKIKIEFNPITGKFDLVSKFNPDRIVTNEYNAAGHLLVTYDPFSGTYLSMDPVVVTDNEGNVVVVGC
jgi:hypothetical protein